MIENQDASRSENRVEKVLTLFRNLGKLEANIDFEPSFKAVHNQLFENRLLLGIDRPEMESSRDEQIVHICENIGMPDNLLVSLKGSLPDANHVYFGVEKNEDTLVFKAYLEFRDKIQKEIGGARVAGGSFPLFTGFKWDAFSPTRQAVTRYSWYPSLPIPEIFKRLRMTIESSRHRGLMEIVRGITNRASERISPDDMQYLEVTEEGNPRKSFDLNLYKSGLRLEELYPYLLQAQRNYAISSDRFDSFYQKIKTERFGHLAGGIDRDDKNFMTVYYGVKCFHSSRFGAAAVVSSDRAESE